ncbi:MAG: hypothetical protein ACOY90_12385 [Candidatus Zhuqueibacterota bacterium]
MEKHIQVLGVMYIVFGALGILSAAFLFTAIVGGGILSGDDDAMRITLIVGVILAGFCALVALPGIIAGIGLLKRQNWARVMAMILGILSLPLLPIGTALGIYTLWVVLSQESNRGNESATPVS